MQIAVGGCLAQKDRGEIVAAGAVGRRRLRHPQHRLAAGPARARRGTTSEAQVEILGVARGLPVHPADPARVRLRGVGLDLGRLQQHLHVLHRAEPARQGERPPARRHPGRDRGAGRRGRPRGDAARPERQHLRRRVRRPAGVRQAAARVRRDRRARAGAVHQPAPGGLHRRRHRRDGRDAQRHAAACTCRCSPARTACSRRCAAPTAATRTSASSTGSASSIPDAAITTDIIVGFPGETEEDFQGTLDVVRAARFASAFTFQYSIRARHPGGDDGRPGAQGRRAGAVRAARRAAGGDLLGREPRRSRAATSRCWSPRARAARTPRPQRLSGRARDNRLVHFAVPEGAERAAARATWSPSQVTYGAPHHLVADAALEGGPTPCGGPRRRRLGCAAGRAGPARRASAWGCRRSATAAADGPGPSSDPFGPCTPRLTRPHGVAAHRDPGEPVLHVGLQPSTASTRARTLVVDMSGTDGRGHGVRLAAPQIGVGLRVGIWQMANARGARAAARRQPDAHDPRIRAGAADPDEETAGCLSVPGEAFPRKRADRAHVIGFDVDGHRGRVRRDRLVRPLHAARVRPPRRHALRRPPRRPAGRDGPQGGQAHGWGKPGDSWHARRRPRPLRPRRGRRRHRRSDATRCVAEQTSVR